MILSKFTRGLSTIRNLIPIILSVYPLYTLPSFADNGKKIEPSGPIISTDNRYIDHGDNTITDTKTELMWIKQDSYLHTKRWLNWFQAKEYINKHFLSPVGI